MKLYDKKFLIYGNCMIRSFGQPGKAGSKKALRIGTKLEESKTFEQTTHKMENPNLHSSNSSGTNTMKTNSATSKQRNNFFLQPKNNKPRMTIRTSIPHIRNGLHKKCQNFKCE